jgi:hypothetical protein
MQMNLYLDRIAQCARRLMSYGPGTAASVGFAMRYEADLIAHIPLDNSARVLAFSQYASWYDRAVNGDQGLVALKADAEKRVSELRASTPDLSGASILVDRVSRWYDNCQLSSEVHYMIDGNLEGGFRGSVVERNRRQTCHSPRKRGTKVERYWIESSDPAFDIDKDTEKDHSQALELRVAELNGRSREFRRLVGFAREVEELVPHVRTLLTLARRLRGPQ